MFLSNYQQRSRLPAARDPHHRLVVPAQRLPETDAPARPAPWATATEAGGDEEPGRLRRDDRVHPPRGAARLSGVRVHGSRYGQPDPPDEKFLVYVLSEDQSEVIGTRMAPYSLFECGPERWVEVPFLRRSRRPAASGSFSISAPTRRRGSTSVTTPAPAGGIRIGLPGVRPRGGRFRRRLVGSKRYWRSRYVVMHHPATTARPARTRKRADHSPRLIFPRISTFPKRTPKM